MKQSCLTGLGWLVLLYAAGLTAAAHADEAALQILLARYSALEQQLYQNQFMRPVVLESLEAGDRISGEIYVVIPYPFAMVSASLDNPDNWCDMMSLHINTKYCRAAESPDNVILDIYVGKKTPQDLEDAEHLAFNYVPAAQTPTYLAIRLSARKGPLGTRDYRIGLEAAPLPGAGTFLHFTYAYSTGLLARIAIKTYLATIGRGKTGFTSLGMGSDGQARYIGGMRALVERNTMRYYLAIESFLAATGEPTASQLETRLQSWFAAVEQYPQLQEMSRSQYMEMKHDEYLRQQRTD